MNDYLLENEKIELIEKTSLIYAILYGLYIMIFVVVILFALIFAMHYDILKDVLTGDMSDFEVKLISASLEAKYGTALSAITWITFILTVLYTYINNLFVITNQRIILLSGLSNKKIKKSAFLKDIVKVQKSLSKIIFHINDGSKLAFKGVKNKAMMKFKAESLIQEAKNKNE